MSRRDPSWPEGYERLPRAELAEPGRVDAPSMMAAEDFVAVADGPRVDPLLGAADQEVIPVGADVMMYGGGSRKDDARDRRRRTSRRRGRLARDTRRASRARPVDRGRRPEATVPAEGRAEAGRMDRPAARTAPLRLGRPLGLVQLRRARGSRPAREADLRRAARPRHREPADRDRDGRRRNDAGGSSLRPARRRGP